MKKNLTLFILVTYLTQISYSQFKGVAGGFAFAAKSSISTIGYAKAGGGIILKREAIKSNDDANLVFNNVTFKEDTGISTIYFSTSKCEASLSNYTWLMKDAAIMVNGESNHEIYRDVNLLSTPTYNEDTILYPENKYWYVELNKDLIGTKSGEILLLVDLLQTDIGFYSDSINREQDSLNYKTAIDSIYDYSIVESYSKCLKYDSLKLLNSFSELDSFRIPLIKKLAIMHLYGLTDYYDAKFYLKYLHEITNWTYNDEQVPYTFTCSCDNNKLLINGVPHFTYITAKFVNTDYTNYFDNNKFIITNLNNEIISKAEDFARVASFFRYLKNNEKSVWKKIFSYYKEKNPKASEFSGNTPRIIKK